MRDHGRYAEAAILYEEALNFGPGNADLHLQCGHMFKEARRFADAERHYRLADAARPADPEIALHLAHFLKVTDRPDEALAAFRRMAASWPGSASTQAEIDALMTMLRGPAQRPDAQPARSAADAETPRATTEAQPGLAAALAAGRPIQPSLLPARLDTPSTPPSEGLVIHRVGRPERTAWDVRRTLRGVEAIRGFCITGEPLEDLAISINGRVIFRRPFDEGHPLKDAAPSSPLAKYVFNAWLDVGAYPIGLYDIEVRATCASGRRHVHREEVVIEAPYNEAAFPQSDSLVSIDPADPRSLDDQVNARPTMIRSTTRSLFTQTPRCILVQRIDQLGDLVVSVGAIRRLRQMFPAARLVGLVSTANGGLAATLGLFDEIVTTEFPEDVEQRRRIMTLDQQERLLALLAPYEFDLAIDLADNGWSRRVLLLSGAKFLYGLRADGDVPGMNADVDGNAYDRLNGYATVPHANRMRGMIDWLAALSSTDATIVPREPTLRRSSSDSPRPYAVLHDGARLKFSRWPHFAALARTILAQTVLDVAVLIDDDADRHAFPRDLLDDPRVRLMQARMEFDTFDALLAECAVFVGNDSGPKHLAALRGRPVVSIHSSRINWSEWGQTGVGYILSRKMPCAGCRLHYDAEECGRDFACVRDIAIDEVFAAVAMALSDGPS